MQRRVLYKNLELGVINLGGLLKELRHREFTGYIRNKGWDYEDFIGFWEGNPMKVVSVKEDGSKEELKMGDYVWIDRGRAIDVVETDPLTLANVFRPNYSLEEVRALIIAGIGEEITDPIKFSLFNLDNALLSFKRGHFTGYIAWVNPIEVVGVCILYDGVPIALNTGKVWDMEAQSLIAGKLGDDTFIHIHTLEPEIALMANSLRIGVKKETFFSPQEIDAGIYEEVSGKGGRFSFIYKGSSIFSYSLDLGEVEYTNFELESPVSVWTISLINTPTPLEISFDKTEVEMIPPEIVHKVRDSFVEEIGPVGPVLWNRILRDLGVKEDIIPKSMIDKLLEKLASEIPDGKHSEAFLNKVRRSLE